MKTEIPFRINSISSEKFDELKMLCRRSLDNDVINKRLNSKGQSLDIYVEKLFKVLWLNEIKLASLNKICKNENSETYYEKVSLKHGKIDKLVAVYKANSLSMITERIVKILYNLDDPLTLPLIARQLIEYWAWFVYNESVLIALSLNYFHEVASLGLSGNEKKIIFNPLSIECFVDSLGCSPANLATYVEQKIGEKLVYHKRKNNVSSFQREIAKQAKFFAGYLSSYTKTGDPSKIDKLVDEYRLCCSLTHPTSLGLIFSSPDSARDKMVLGSTYLLSALDAIKNVSENMYLLINCVVHPDGVRRLIYNFSFLNSSLNKYAIRMKDYEVDYSYDVMKKMFQMKGCPPKI